MTPTAAPTRPRRVRMGPTGWMLVRRRAAEALGPASAARLPSLSPHEPDVPAAATALRDRGVVDDDGRPVRAVAAGLRVLAEAPVTIVVARHTPATRLEAAWATSGTPAAGVVVSHRDRGDRTHDVEVELQLLTGAALATEVVEQLGLPSGSSDGASGRIDLLDAATDGDLPEPLDEVVVDGCPVLHATLQVSGPRGTRLATVVGDGVRAWQVGAHDHETMGWRGVDRAAVHGALVASLADQVAAIGASRGG